MEWLLFVLALCMMGFCAWTISLQAKQIDRLQDRLMARNYGEYVSTQTRPETPQEEQRDPLSWHDDPSIGERD